MRAPWIALVLGIASACSYDYSNVPLVDAATGGGADAGSRFSCDPILQDCTAMLRCALVPEPGATFGARCVVAGTGGAAAPCDGPEDCAAGFYCASTAAGSASCTSYCSDVAPTCADGRACDTATTLFAIGLHAGHPCR